MDRTPLDTLSPREREVLRLVARNYSTDEIARELGSSSHTVNNQIKSARAKLGGLPRNAAARLLTEAEEHSHSLASPPKVMPALADIHQPGCTNCDRGDDLPIGPPATASSREDAHDVGAGSWINHALTVIGKTIAVAIGLGMLAALAVPIAHSAQLIVRRILYE